MIDYLKKFRLDEKTAFVVGGLGLIGREVSTAFASAGAKTIVLDLESEHSVAFEKEICGDEFEFYFRPFDCADMDCIEKNFSALLDEFGCPDVFINCSYPRTEDWDKSSFKDITFDSFRENIDIHMNSYAWLARKSAEAMSEAGNGGSIIQLGSIYGIVGQDLTVYESTEMHENMTYATIKGGITSLSRQMASYYGRYNVRVNTLCPGGLANKQNSVFVRNYSKKTPLKRLGRADEIASTALFLASDASSYITGETILVDGGWTSV